MPFARLSGLRASQLVASALVGMMPFAATAIEDRVAMASWYGEHHQGLRTSSGEVFDQEHMTAASASLPLGSRVRVTMHATGQSVVVVVNDRMGGHDRIDLSKGAARRIGLLDRGRGAVSIAAADEAVEVAEASEDEIGDFRALSSAPRGRRHRRPVVLAVAAARPCCHAPSAVPVRH